MNAPVEAVADPSKGPEPILSAEEMSSILKPAGAGSGTGLAPMTLGAPPPLSRDEEFLWTAKMKEAARALGASLGAMLRKETGAEALSPRRRRFSDLTAGISEATATVIGSPASPGSAGLALSLPLMEALKAVDLLLGGAGTARPSSGAPTALESALILEFSSEIAKALSSADQKNASRWRVDTLAFERENAPALPGHETAIVVDLEIGLAEGPMRIAAWIPEGWVASGADPGEKPAMAGSGEGIAGMPACLTGRLEGGWLSLGEALSLQSGDLVRLDPGAGSKLCVNGVPVFTGTLIHDMEPISFEIDSLAMGELS